MVEKRRAKRMQVELSLKISSLFMQDNIKVEKIFKNLLTNSKRCGIMSKSSGTTAQSGA